MPHTTVWVNRSAVADMVAEAERAHPDETGGMRLGWTNLDRKEVVVATTVGPGPIAEHHPTRFAPDADWQQTHLDAVYRRTSTKITYLGDWHVHPQGGFGMSRRDRRTMAHTANAPEARCPHPLMALLFVQPADQDFKRRPRHDSNMRHKV
ncbi:MAG: Mov34/MPN/PAD-1 family protein [Patescibacteria group bacterium]